MAQPDRDTDVLVVGAGPTGMLTALSLAERGVRVELVDTYRRTALRSYALALHPESLRLLDGLGLAERLIERGQRIDRIALYVDGASQATLELVAIGGSHPYVLVVPQFLLEGAMEQALAGHAVSVGWGQQLLSYAEDPDGVTALVGRLPAEDETDVDVETRRVHARYLVGADGYNSFVRRLLETPWVATGTPLVYGLLEFEADLDPIDTLSVSFLGADTDVLWPLGPTRGRFSVQLDPDEPRPQADGLKRRVLERAPWFRGGFGAIEWSAAIRFEPRLVKRFGHDRVWLVGDAGHFTSPVGVQSMNIGLREAHDLARRLGDILLDGGPATRLLYYNEERHREWKMLLGVKDRLRVDAAAPAWARERATRLVASLPASGQDLNLLLEQVGLRLYWLRRKGATR